MSSYTWMLQRRISLFHFLELLQDKLKKFESIITSQQVQIQNTEEMLGLNKVGKKTICPTNSTESKQTLKDQYT